MNKETSKSETKTPAFEIMKVKCQAIASFIKLVAVAIMLLIILVCGSIGYIVINHPRASGQVSWEFSLAGAKLEKPAKKVSVTVDGRGIALGAAAPPATGSMLPMVEQ